MMYFLATFGFMLIVVVIMAIGVIFGRRAIKGSCGGTGDCACEEKCDKRKKRDAEAAGTHKVEFNPDILKKSVD
ncbi:MAG: (Na+)-NQR maturation NqrM [Methylococcales bacterium]|nr:(Na+)-NQR maturation NqrM [Methylococcales bacterium]